MARIAGVNIPQNKLVRIGLTYIYGIGSKFSRVICESVGVDKNKRVNQLNESEVNAKDLCLLLLNEGLLCKETHKTVIRFAPPLMISKKDLDWAIDKITKVFKTI